MRARLKYPLSSLGVNKKGDFGVSFGLSGSGSERAVAVDEPGVYPIEVGVVGAGDERTEVRHLDDRRRSRPTAKASQPLRLSWIWQLVDRTQCTLADGNVGQVRARRHADRGPPRSHRGPARERGSLSAHRRRRARDAGELDRPLASAIRAPARRAPACDAQCDAKRSSCFPSRTSRSTDRRSRRKTSATQVPGEYVAGSNAIDAATGEIPDPRTAFEDPVDDATRPPAHPTARRAVRRSRHRTRTGRRNRARRRSRSR